MMALRRLGPKGILLGILVWLISAGVMLARTRQIPLHEDEPGWISSAYYYTDLALARDGRLESWEGIPCGTWGSLNMPLGKWLIGIPLVAYRSQTGRAFVGPCGGERKSEPPLDIVRWARAPSALASSLICVVVFWMVFLVDGVWTALLAAAMVLCGGCFARWGARATTDAFYLLFLAAGALVACRLLAARSRPEVLRLTLLSGVVAGLAASIKVTGLPLAAALFAACLVFRVRLGATPTRAAAALCLGFAATSLLVIYALNPFLWPAVQSANPEGLAASIQSQARRNADTQGLAPPSREMARLRASTALRFPLLYVRWKKLMDDQRAMGLGQWHGPRWIDLHRTLFSSSPTLLGKGLFLLAGIAWGLARAWRAWRGRQPDPWWPVTAFFLAQYLLILGLLSLNWDRYFLPTIVAGQLLVAGATVAAGRAVVERIRSRGARPPAPTTQL